MMLDAKVLSAKKSRNLPLYFYVNATPLKLPSINPSFGSVEVHFGRATEPWTCSELLHFAADNVVPSAVTALTRTLLAGESSRKYVSREDALVEKSDFQQVFRSRIFAKDVSHV